MSNHDTQQYILDAENSLPVGDLGVLHESPDAWDKPDIGKPRSTAEFINDTWASRRNPVYALSAKEVSILLSKTFKGWLWRFIMRMARYSRKVNFSDQMSNGDAPTEAEKAFLAQFHTSSPTESERTLQHYLAVAEKFAPKPGIASTFRDPIQCDSTLLRQNTEVTPRKPKKKGRKTVKNKRNR